jgi:hypothetical protein
VSGRGVAMGSVAAAGVAGRTRGRRRRSADSRGGAAGGEDEGVADAGLTMAESRERGAGVREDWDSLWFRLYWLQGETLADSCEVMSHISMNHALLERSVGTISNLQAEAKNRGQTYLQKGTSHVHTHSTLGSVILVA